MIAALYAVATLALAPLSFGPLQLRVSEALTILPAKKKAAISGLTVGCALANAIGLAMGANACGAADILFGTAATLLAAIASRALRGIELHGLPVLSALMPALFNGLIIGAELTIIYKLPFWLCALQVAAGELIASVALGLPLYSLLRRNGLLKDE